MPSRSSIVGSPASEFLVDGRCTVADIALYAYTHVAHEAGIDMSAYPAIAPWLERVEGTDGFVNDLEPYPENAGFGRLTAEPSAGPPDRTPFCLSPGAHSRPCPRCERSVEIRTQGRRRTVPKA